MRLSESVIWDLQAQFYREHAIDFWRNRATFTSANPLLVKACANLLNVYFTENKSRFEVSQPIYLVELGAGSGCFAYRFLRDFQRVILSNNELPEFEFRFVMTDFFEDIVPIWSRNLRLKPFVDKAQLDFAVFDPGADSSFRTSLHHWMLDADVANPPVFFANALFDTIACDGFSIGDGQVKEVNVGVKSESENAMDALLANEISLEQSVGADVVFPFYKKPNIDSILLQYRDELAAAVFTLPIKAFDMLDNLRKLSRERLTLFCSSRGFTDLDYVKEAEGLFYHDLSFPLNFDALRRYFGTVDGDMLLPGKTGADYISRNLAFAAQHPLANASPIALEFERGVSEMRIARESVRGRLNTISVEVLHQSPVKVVCEILQLSHYDPDVFLKCMTFAMDAVENELPTAAPGLTAAFADALERVDENVYTFDKPIPESKTAANNRDELFAMLINVWQRATEANHNPPGSSVFDFDDL